MGSLNLVSKLMSGETSSEESTSAAAAEAAAPVESEIPEELLNTLVPEAPAKAPEELVPDAELEAALESDEPPKAAQAWAKTKHELKTARERVKELEAKINELDGAKLPQETEQQYRDRIAELDKRVAQLSLAESEAFKIQYDQPILQGLGRAARLLVEHGGKAKEDAQALIQQAARMKFADRNRFLLDEAPELAATINQMLLNVDDMVLVRQEAIQKAEATKAALAESEKRTREVQQVRSLDQHLSKAVEDSIASGNFFLQKSKADGPKAQAWNQSVELDTQAIKQVLLKGDPSEISRLVTDGYTSRKLRAEYARVLEENRSLKSQIKEVAAVRPTMNGRESPPPPSTKEVPKGVGVESLVGHLLRTHAG